MAVFHHLNQITCKLTLDDLNADYLNEYVHLTSGRKMMGTLGKQELAASLGLLDKNDPLRKKVKNYALLMFSERPDKYIPYAYTELIIDMYGSKRKMESKRFSGSIWKQYHNIVNFISDNYLNTMVIRDDGKADSRKVTNYPYVAVEELVANAIVHNNYENGKPVQIYISERQINIVNYNKPLPPLKISDLNERRIFNERDTENPEIRDMFKSLGIIESFGTGIGEAKRSLEDNGSPQLYYKIFSESDNITSVVIPVNEEYFKIKIGDNSHMPIDIESESITVKNKINNASYSNKIRGNLLIIHDRLKDRIFGNIDVMEVLHCSQATATGYIKRLHDGLQMIDVVTGAGKGKYRFK